MSDDFLLDQVERNQRQQTLLRRDRRDRRRRWYLVGGLLVVIGFALGLPSLVSHSSLGRSIMIRGLADYGLESDVDRIRIGWLTPLQVEGLRIHGKRGTRIRVDRLDVDLTAGDLVSSATLPNAIGVRGLDLQCSIAEGRSSIEEDFQALMQSDDEGSSVLSIELQNIAVSMTDEATGDTWRIDQSNAEVECDETGLRTQFEGVLTEPGGGRRRGAGIGRNDIVVVSGRNRLATRHSWRIDSVVGRQPAEAKIPRGRRFATFDDSWRCHRRCPSQRNRSSRNACADRSVASPQSDGGRPRFTGLEQRTGDTRRRIDRGGKPRGGPPIDGEHRFRNGNPGRCVRDVGVAGRCG